MGRAPTRLVLAEALSASGSEDEAKVAAQRALERARESAAADPDSADWQAQAHGQAKRLIAGER